MRLAIVYICACLLWALPAKATVEENDVAARMTQEATDFLDQMLGPGRAKVLITVQGESSDLQTQTEVTTPILKLDEQGNKVLPGYTGTGQKEAKVDYFQKDMETSSRKGGFMVKKLRVSVVLDSGLPEVSVNAARRVLPELLRMDGARGDEFVVLRAALLPPWKSALLTHEGMRSLAILIAASLLAVLFCLTLYFTAMRMVRVFVAELAARRPYGPMEAPGARLPAAGAEAAGARELPDLGMGGMPRLEEGLEGAPLPGGMPALGRRFDFLSSREPAEISDLLAKEPPEDLSLLFAYLADSNPDLASRIFAALPQTLQGEISSSLVKLSTADPERLAMLENRIKTTIEFGLRGSDRLGRILSRLPPGEREGILGDLMSKDPTGAEDVERSLLPFESIADLKPQELRRLIVTVPYQDWGIALRGTAPELVERILAELPPGTRNLVMEASQAPQPRDKVLECRSKILSQLHLLATRGQIELNQQGAQSELI